MIQDVYIASGSEQHYLLPLVCVSLHRLDVGPSPWA